MALVLDVDETLWRCSIAGVHKKRKLQKVDARVEIKVRDEYQKQVRVLGCDLSWRPGLHAFLEWIQQRRAQGFIEGPWAYTTGEACYISAVLGELDPDGAIFGTRVLAKDSCIKTSTPGFYLKDLSMVPSTGGLERTILVDNNPVSCILNPENSILIHDWLGACGEPDTELARVMSVLDDAISDCVEGDYAASITRATKGHPGFKQNLARLHKMVEANSPIRNARDALVKFKELMPEVQAVKRDLLGPGPGC